MAIEPQHPKGVINLPIDFSPATAGETCLAWAVRRWLGNGKSRAGREQETNNKNRMLICCCERDRASKRSPFQSSVTDFLAPRVNVFANSSINQGHQPVYMSTPRVPSLSPTSQSPVEGCFAFCIVFMIIFTPSAKGSWVVVGSRVCVFLSIFTFYASSVFCLLSIVNQSVADRNSRWVEVDR